MKTKTFSLLFLMGILATATIAYAVVQFTYQISNSATIHSTYTLEIWNEDKTEIVTSLDWGEFRAVDEMVAKTLWLKNTGSDDCKIAWNVTSFPDTVFSMSAYYQKPTLEWQAWTGTVAPSGTPVMPGEYQHIKFELTCIVLIAGEHTFDINIDAHS